jgi:hypothetical protein
MPFFDDLKNAFNRYAADYVTLAIVDEAYLNGRPDRTPNNIGRGQARRFKVKITNNGPLEMMNIELRLGSVSAVGSKVFWCGDNPIPLHSRDIDWKDEYYAIPWYGNYGPRGPYGGGISPLLANGGSVVGTQWYYYQAPSEDQPPGTLLAGVSLGRYEVSWDYLLKNPRTGLRIGDVPNPKAEIFKKVVFSDPEY